VWIAFLISFSIVSKFVALFIIFLYSHIAICISVGVVGDANRFLAISLKPVKPVPLGSYLEGLILSVPTSLLDL